jgi:hypothetical protein
MPQQATALVGFLDGLSLSLILGSFMMDWRHYRISNTAPYGTRGPRTFFSVILLALVTTQFDYITFRFSDWLARCGTCRGQRLAI